MSRRKRAINEKNARRVASVLNDELDLCTYGKVIKACGSKMFVVALDNKKECLAFVRGKMDWISSDNIVLLNIRDYESRSETEDAVYDIVAKFDTRTITKLIKNKTIPTWMTKIGDDADDDSALLDLFDYEEEEEEEEDEEGEQETLKASQDKRNKKTWKNNSTTGHRRCG